MKFHGILLIAFSFLMLPAEGTGKQPNIILIFTDDQGYNDLGCYGSEKIKTPNLDQMAAEGLRLTNFYAQPVCGVSRAALMTGSYPIRVAEPGNVKRLHTEMHTREVTMAEVLGDAGYATALIGKWHAGKVMPNEQGFDYFYGTPRFNGFTVFVEDTNVRSPILRNQEVVVPKVESWDRITQDYTKEALTWIEKQQDKPFFLYLAHNMPHVPVGASEAFKGKSAYGPYGDTIEEIDWSYGQILSKLKELGIDENTLIVFTSDNGPWIETTRGMKPDAKPFIPADHSGLATPLRGWKMSSWEGGSRVPFIARWPGKIAKGQVSNELLSTMDLMPTFASIAGGNLPEVTLDGEDASDFLLGKTDASPRDNYLYYSGCLLTGVRSGKWKLVVPRVSNPPGMGWWGRMLEEVSETQLFDLDSDPGESKNLALANPEVVARLMKQIESARTELGDIDRTGSEARFFDEGPRKLQVPIRQAKDSSATVRSTPSHHDGFKPLGDLRFCFESGKLEGWTVTAGELGNPVSNLKTLPRQKEKPFNQEGSFHLSTLDTEDGVSDKQTGILKSPGFVLLGDQASFLVSGGFDESKLYVALCSTASGKELLKAGGFRDPQMKRIIWDVSQWKGQSVYLKIIDQSTEGWGHLLFDDFSTNGES